MTNGLRDANRLDADSSLDSLRPSEEYQPLLVRFGLARSIAQAGDTSINETSAGTVVRSGDVSVRFPFQNKANMNAFQKKLLGIAVAMALTPLVHAMDIETRAIGPTAIAGDVNSVRTSALRQAKRNAVLAALDNVVGAGTSRNPDVQAKLDDLVVRLGDDSIYSVTPRSVDGQYGASTGSAIAIGSARVGANPPTIVSIMPSHFFRSSLELMCVQSC